MHAEPRALARQGRSSEDQLFPTKLLGCYRDGGAINADDALLTEYIESIRIYGKVTPSDTETRNYLHGPKHVSLHVGMNSHLDATSAARLLEKQKIFSAHLAG
jgi:dTDP-4-amino-4,6-dideoxygalactose transaminase